MLFYLVSCTLLPLEIIVFLFFTFVLRILFLILSFQHIFLSFQAQPKHFYTLCKLLYPCAPFALPTSALPLYHSAVSIISCVLTLSVGLPTFYIKMKVKVKMKRKRDRDRESETATGKTKIRECISNARG